MTKEYAQGHLNIKARNARLDADQEKLVTQGKLKSPRPRSLKHQGETGTPRRGPRARNINSTHNDHYKQ
eukprot:2037099-Pleurochrysis_carterae.AAC.1